MSDKRSTEVERGEFGLVSDAVRDLRGLFKRTAGVKRVWVFGSRARGDWRPRSDLDLAVDAPAWSAADVLRFKDAVRQLPMVYPVDVVHWQTAPEELRKEIRAEGRVFWE